MKDKKHVCPISFNYDNGGKIVAFSIPGKPRGKERPRMARCGKFVTTYTPKNTVEYEKLIRTAYRSTVGDVFLEGPIEAELHGVFPIPKSTSKKKTKEMLEGDILYTHKIDCDNLGKIVLDALNKIAYRDDSQICKMSVTKEYGNNPRVDVILREVNKLKY